ncbi:MAG: hypothetical protein MUF23_09755 [Pirellula sp.]|jgi:hypothetical protein|nr:hypothetical protein [Pirellula sp.]
MLGRIVDTKTSDQIQLHGFFVTPATSSNRIWIIVHGVNGNFYSSTLLMQLAQTAIEAGNAALLINTRGHDLASFGSTETPARLGSMYEIIEDAMLDLRAWIGWCQREGFEQIGLMAHSLGAVKCAFALAHQDLRDEWKAVDRFLALSPPRLNTELLLRDPAKCEVFRQHLNEAQAFCREGKDNHVMRVRFPLPNWVSARTFADKYGSGDKYDYLTWVPKISARTLWMFGEHEVRLGSANFLDADLLLSERLPAGHLVGVIENADHSYRATREALRIAIVEWIGQ